MFTRQVLMAARWAPQAAHANASQVVHACRDAAAHTGVTGGLLFDGEFFLQLLQGMVNEVCALTAVWLRQPLLAEARVLVDQPAPPAGRDPWKVGFVEAGALEAVVCAPSASAMVAAFLHTLSLTDAQ